MTYTAVLNYLFAQLPMFHRVGAAAYKADLKNTIKICKQLRNPEKNFFSIHIAGTNGKGSSSHMLAAVLQQCGYRTGLYTSPHLIDFRERIRVNGKMIPKKEVCSFVEKHKDAFEKIKPSFFEWTVGLAFDYFAREKVEIAIIETGLGGRLDSTNVINPLACLITNIDLDHTNLLGNTIEMIAAEKAGIIKRRVPVVISERKRNTDPVFVSSAKALNSQIFFAEDEYISFFHTLKNGFAEICVVRKSDGAFDVFQLDLLGAYQKKNLAGVLQMLDLLSGKIKGSRKKFKISVQDIKIALRKVGSLTGLRGRFEILRNTKPMIVCDTGHNSAGISEVLNMLGTLKYKKLHFVVGMVNDKDPDKVLSQLPKKGTRYYFTKADLPRSLSEVDLKKRAKKIGLNGNSYKSVEEACKAAEATATPKDLIFIGGSTFVVADALKNRYQ
jgi:dihydrofolate synthase/folylpolyglutamate synthase